MKRKRMLAIAIITGVLSSWLAGPFPRRTSTPESAEWARVLRVQRI